MKLQLASLKEALGPQLSFKCFISKNESSIFVSKLFHRRLTEVPALFTNKERILIDIVNSFFANEKSGNSSVACFAIVLLDEIGCHTYDKSSIHAALHMLENLFSKICDAIEIVTSVEDVSDSMFSPDIASNFQESNDTVGISHDDCVDLEDVDWFFDKPPPTPGVCCDIVTSKEQKGNEAEISLKKIPTSVGLAEIDVGLIPGNPRVGSDLWLAIGLQHSMPAEWESLSSSVLEGRGECEESGCGDEWDKERNLRRHIALPMRLALVTAIHCWGCHGEDSVTPSSSLSSPQVTTTSPFWPKLSSHRLSDAASVNRAQFMAGSRAKAPWGVLDELSMDRVVVQCFPRLPPRLSCVHPDALACVCLASDCHRALSILTHEADRQQSYHQQQQQQQEQQQPCENERISEHHDDLDEIELLLRTLASSSLVSPPTQRIQLSTGRHNRTLLPAPSSLPLKSVSSLSAASALPIHVRRVVPRACSDGPAVALRGVAVVTAGDFGEGSFGEGSGASQQAEAIKCIWKLNKACNTRAISRTQPLSFFA